MTYNLRQICKVNFPGFQLRFSYCYTTDRSNYIILSKFDSSIQRVLRWDSRLFDCKITLFYKIETCNYCEPYVDVAVVVEFKIWYNCNTSSAFSIMEKQPMQSIHGRFILQSHVFSGLVLHLALINIHNIPFRIYWLILMSGV